MIDGADCVVAFTDGREKGGTARTIEMARRAGITVVIVPVHA